MVEATEEMRKFVKSIPEDNIDCYELSCMECPMDLQKTYGIDPNGPQYSCAAIIITVIKAELKRRIAREQE